MSCQETLYAKVTEVSGTLVTLDVHTSATKNCTQCHQRSGCRSISVYQWFFASRPLTLTNQNYTVGQTLLINFPSVLLVQSVLYLLGLPLMGFIGGVFSSLIIGEINGFLLGLTLASLLFIFAKHRVIRRFSTVVSILADTSESLY